LLLAVVPKLDVSPFYAPEEPETRGGPPFAPAMRVCLLLEADGVGVWASRKMARAGERPVALLALGGEDRPDVRPIRDVRPLPLQAFTAGWVQGGR
jgi:hypothetical protein